MLIYRKKIDETKKIYEYYDKTGKMVTDKTIIEYITKLVIPPAYNEVVIYYEKSPKILFQGLDSKNRLQQIYSPQWRAKADKEKFKALIDFGYQLPKMINEMEKHIKVKTPTREKIISLILSITSLCGFRHGSTKYKELYNSVGLITLDPSHIKFKTIKDVKEAHFMFIGKKGVKNECVIADTILVTELENLTLGKGKKEYIFQYLDKETKSLKHITAIDINNWLKSYNPEFTAKFFRTFNVNTAFIEIMQETNPSSLTEAQRKKRVVEAIKCVSDSVNNTPSICKKSYLNPQLLELYIEHPRKYTSLLIKGEQRPYIKFIKFLESVYL
jgi:DNA topoisomerase IB